MHALRDRRRWSLCLGGAVGLHLALLLFRFAEHRALASTLTLVTEATVEVADVADEAPEHPPGPAPGGGSPEPEAKAGDKAAFDQLVPSLRPDARAVARSDHNVDTPVIQDIRKTFEDQPLEDVKLHPAKSLLLESDAVAMDRDAALQQASMSRSKGFGAGKGGGPGGTGAGWGKGSGSGPRNVLGSHAGPVKDGAFRADVCYIEENTPSISGIKNCTPVSSFYATSLNVSARPHVDGFPGVSGRIEWFAVFYRGRFTVTTADTYDFRLLSDDGSILYIDNRPVINHDGRHSATSAMGSVQLAAGVHDFSLSYYQGPGAFIALQLFVKSAGGSERLFGPRI